MVILVTGSSGLLGRAVASSLSAEGREVVGAGRPELEIPSPDFADLLGRTAFDVVVHCAGPASVPHSLSAPSADFQGSAGVLDGLLDRLRVLDRSPRLVLISSAAVYGDPQRLPVAETDELDPISPYGYHRVACELLLRAHRRLWGLEYVVLRVFSAYGEGLRRQIMWDICRQAVAGDVALEGTGRESRDFVHARDVAGAVGVVIDGAEFAGETFNVGTGVETTTADLAAVLLRNLALGREVLFSGRRRAGDPSNWRADVSRIRRLGFEPRVPIADGARSYAAWAREALAR